MSNPRVLFVNHTSTVSGAEMILLDVVSACRKPAAFLFEDGKLNADMESRGVKVFRSRFGNKFNELKRTSSFTRALPMAGRLSATLAELSIVARSYDLIYANSQKAFVLGSVASSLSRKPIIWHLHDIINASHFGSSQRRLQVGLANRFARMVIAPSRSVADAFIAEGGKPNLVRIVPNGLDVESDATPIDQLRNRLGLPTGPLVGVFSRLAPWKGQHVVLRALAMLPNVKCIIVGGALFGEDDYAESLRQFVLSLGLSQRVSFLGQRSDVQNLMRAVDIVIHPSVSPEPFGRTLVEAMLAQTPIIATDTGAAADILDYGKAGSLVPPGESDALAAAIQKSLTRSSDIEKQVEYGATRARTTYSANMMRQSIAEAIESCVCIEAP